MKVIRDTSEIIEDAIEHAEDYGKAAIEWKEEFPEISRALIAFSDSVMSNVSALHSAIAKVITEYRRENGEPPAPMMAVYDYLHKNHIENASRVRAMQQMYKDS